MSSTRKRTDAEKWQALRLWLRTRREAPDWTTIGMIEHKMDLLDAEMIEWVNAPPENVSLHGGVWPWRRK